MQPYALRDIRLLRRMNVRDWQLKLYSIAFGRTVVDEQRFAPGLQLALESLPTTARRPDRFGVGFCIVHQGRGADYVLLAWWDRENELPLRVFVSTPPGASLARGSRQRIRLRLGSRSHRVRTKRVRRDDTRPASRFRRIVMAATFADEAETPNAIS